LRVCSTGDRRGILRPGRGVSSQNGRKRGSWGMRRAGCSVYVWVQCWHSARSGYAKCPGRHHLICLKVPGQGAVEVRRQAGSIPIIAPGTIASATRTTITSSSPPQAGSVQLARLGKSHNKSSCICWLPRGSNALMTVSRKNVP
jgi:hypothetical protein